MPYSVRRITAKYRPVLSPPGPSPAVLPAPRLTAGRAAAIAWLAAMAAAAAGVAVNAAAAITHTAAPPVRSRRDVPCRSCMKTPSYSRIRAVVGSIDTILHIILSIICSIVSLFLERSSLRTCQRPAGRRLPTRSAAKA